MVDSFWTPHARSVLESAQLGGRAGGGSQRRRTQPGGDGSARQADALDAAEREQLDVRRGALPVLDHSLECADRILQLELERLRLAGEPAARNGKLLST